MRTFDFVTSVMEEATRKINEQHERIEELKRENAALEATLSVVYDANQRGIRAWQQAHPDKSMVRPDQAKLVEWLVNENAELREDKERLDWLVDREAEVQRYEDDVDGEVLYYVETGASTVSASTLRAAIDAARAKEAKP